MKSIQSTHNPPPEPETDPLIQCLSEALRSTSGPIQTWLRAQIELTLAEIPFREGSLKSVQSPPKAISPNRLLTPQEASTLLNIPVRWIYRHTKTLPHRRFGRYIRFPEKELFKWAEGKRNLGI